MALSFQLGYPSVPRSITNPNVFRSDAIDTDGPMAYLTFIQLINVSFEPDSLRLYYNDYLNSWNVKNNSQDKDNQNIIIERYKDFLREISLNYTTLEEKEFLSKINFDDPYDLDVAMGFYGDKIKELISYYNSKRNNVKFNVIRNKLIGTNFGAEKTLAELTLSYLKGIDDGKMLFDYDNINEHLRISIDELYDTNPNYYNQTPDVYKYDNKDLDYGFDIFLKNDQELIAQIFGNISNELKEIKEVDELFDNKRKLTEKYISTDFYYLSTGDTVSEMVSGKLFDCDNTVLNFLNRNYPTTASTPNIDYLKTERLQGFFTPSKTSIILLDGDNRSFSFNLQNIEPNSLYYFPDPSIASGNNDVLSFIVNTSYLKRNFSSGVATNQPNSKSSDTKYYGYVSNNGSKYFDSLFDTGHIEDSKYDIFGNQFGLFKNTDKFRQNVEVVSEIDINSMVIEGHTIYDELFGEGYDFNYTISSSSTDYPYRSGIYTKTSPFSSNNVDVVLSFGKLFHYAEPYYDKAFKSSKIIEVIEGGFIAKYDLTPYPDSSSSDLSSYEFDNGPFYYSDLIECGLYTSNPLQRALLTPLLSANLTEYIRGSALNVLDGGIFPDIDNFSYSLIEDNYAYDDTVFNTTELLSSSIDYNNNGSLFVKNTQTNEVSPILVAMPYIEYKYNQSIVDELSQNITKFDITSDILFLQTPSYLVMDRIEYDGAFLDSNISPIYINYNQSNFDKVSNRFKVNNTVYFCKMMTLSSESLSNDFTLYPEIYSFDIINCKLDKIFPSQDENITQQLNFFSVSGENVRYITLDPPVMAYSSKNDIFNISFLLKDQNNMPILHEYDFYLNPDVKFTKHDIIKFNGNQISNIFNNLSTISLYLSSSYPTTMVEELIL
jgi:hypothetical protein